VYPPVDTAFYYPDDTPRDGSMLVVSALVPYKRIDLAIEASRLSGVPLRIAGEGPERERLERLSGDRVEFLGRRSNDEIRQLYRRAAAVLLPGEEDFGIVPVEAQACGCPVIALARGGALETVVDGVTGILVTDGSPAAFAEAMERVKGLRIETQVIRRHAERFGREAFARKMRACIDDLMSEPAGELRNHGQAV
jgi:glycosyltransferase involved in cell wall biosynthesis